MKTIWFSLTMTLASCGVPHPVDRLDQTAMVQVAGSDFRVNWNTRAAQATRMNRVWRPRMEEIAPAAVIAVQQASGCPVRPGSVTGDVALVKMQLDCAGTPRLEGFACEGSTFEVSEGISDVDIICRPR